MSTRVDIRQRILNHFENPVYFTDQAVNDSTQDGYDEIVAFTGLIQKAVVLPFQNGLSYYDMISLIPDYVGVVAIFNKAINRWMLPSSLRKLDQVRIDWETAFGVPYYFSVVSHRYMAIYKKPNVDSYGDMYVFYKASAPTLTDSTTLALPDDFLNTLEDYVETDLWEQNQEWGKAAVHLNAYADNLAEVETWIKSQRQPDRGPSLK